MTPGNMSPRSQCRETIVEKLLADVRQQLNRLWDNDEDPVACQLRDRRGYILDSIFIPPLPEGDSQPQPKRDESLGDTVNDEDDDDEEDEAGITATESSILHVLSLADKPMKAKSIAKLAGVNFSDYFRRTLYGLVKKGKITSLEDHSYQITDRG